MPSWWWWEGVLRVLAKETDSAGFCRIVRWATEGVVCVFTSWWDCSECVSERVWGLLVSVKLNVFDFKNIPKCHLEWVAWMYCWMSSANFIPPPVKHVNSCLKQASGCYVPAGASVPGSGLFSVCDERLVLWVGGFSGWWPSISRWSSLGLDVGVSDPDLAQCENE